MMRQDKREVCVDNGEECHYTGNMMKATLFSIVTAMAAVVAVPAVYADGTEGDTPAAAPAENVIGEALKGIKKFATGKKPNTNAKYYILLESASWCGPCNQEMPHVVKAYKEMAKTKQVELILMSHDNDGTTAKAFMRRYHGNFPCIIARSADAKVIPGFKPAGGIPHAIIMDASGKVITEGHGSIVAKWKDHCPL